MRRVRLNNSMGEALLVLASFALVAVLLEPEGLAAWANRLEIGWLRTAALPAVTALHNTLAPLHTGEPRRQILLTLARLQWSDDPELLAEARRLELASLSLPSAANAASAPVAGQPSGLQPPAAFTHAPGFDVALAAAAPATANLTPLPPPVAGHPRVVALAGDSMMAVGISATFLQQAAAHPNLHLVKAFKSGTGLARPELFNWMNEYPAMLGTEKPDVIVVAIGANDGQGFVVDKKVLPYGSEAWTRVYQERVASYLAMIGAGGARIVWIGLPPMKLAVYNQKIDTINRIDYSVVSQSHQADWFSPLPYLGGDSGEFREFETLPNGKTHRLRAPDGIHLSDEGAAPITTAILRWLDPPAPKPAATTPAAATATASQNPDTTHKARRAVRRSPRG